MHERRTVALRLASTSKLIRELMLTYRARCTRVKIRDARRAAIQVTSAKLEVSRAALGKRTLATTKEVEI